MTRDELRAAVVNALGEIAPESDASALPDATDLREALDLDSMDFQNFVIRLHRDLQVEIPERDYPRLTTLGGGVDYLASKCRENRDG